MPDWDAHEGLRAQVLWHSSSNFTFLGGHVAISASLPSGLSGVRRARDSLSELLLRVGCYPTCDFGSNYLPIVDQHRHVAALDSLAVRGLRHSRGIPPVLGWDSVDCPDSNRLSARQHDYVLARARKDANPSALYAPLG